MRNRRPRLVALDLDGTIVRPDGSVSGRTRRALRRARDAGTQVVFVTGRAPRKLHEIAEAAGHAGLAVCANGALVLDLAGNRTVGRRLIGTEALRRLGARLALELPDAGFGVDYETGFGHEPGYSHSRTRVGRRCRVADFEQLADRPAARLVVQVAGAPPAALTDRVARCVDGSATVTPTAKPGLVELAAPGVTKGTSLAVVARLAGVDAADVVAFGDTATDLSMLTWAGTGVAMSTAPVEVRGAADAVTGSVEEDGVATALEAIYDR